MPQHSIRFPDELYAAIEAEARRRGHPHTFSSVVVNTLREALRPGHAKPLPGPEKTSKTKGPA